MLRKLYLKLPRIARIIITKIYYEFILQLFNLRSLAKIFIPNFLKPYAYRVYLHFHTIYIHYTQKHQLIRQLLKNSSLITQKLAKLPTIQILQPTFYDLDGENYFSGGAERYLNDLTKIILSMGYTPYIVQCGNKFWHRVHGNINVFGVPSGANYMILNKFAHLPSWGKPKLRIYSPFTLAFPNCTKNSIGISHGIFWDRADYPNIFSAIHKSFKSLNIFISVDTSTLSWFRATTPGITSKKDMRYIPNYVDLEKFCPNVKDNSRIIIMYPRRLVKERGFFMVTKIAKKILSKHQNTDFHFVGHKYPLAGNILNNLIKKFKGRIVWYKESEDNMAEVYQTADIVLIPTVSSEGTSLSCLEAMASGKAVIATNIGGLSDLIIDGYNGLLINPNTDELYQAIDKLVNNSELRKQLGDNAIKVAKCFDKKIWEAKWQDILKQAINQNITNFYKN